MKFSTVTGVDAQLYEKLPVVHQLYSEPGKNKKCAYYVHVHETCYSERRRYRLMSHTQRQIDFTFLVKLAI